MPNYMQPLDAEVLTWNSMHVQKCIKRAILGYEMKGLVVRFDEHDYRNCFKCTSLSDPLRLTRDGNS